jgi:hypothetical protein
MIMALLCCCLLATTADALMPKFSWDTLGGLSFFHSSNATGEYTDEAIKLMAKFRMVTIEKWMEVQEPGRQRTMSSNIVETLRRVKAANPSVSTVFYYNSVCNFPQYASLYDQYAAMPDKWLRTEAGEAVFLSCAGFSSTSTTGKYNASYPQPYSGMPIYNFASPEVQALWISECVNATRSGVVDGCFSDRSVDGVPLHNVSLDAQAAYNAGHLLAHQTAQKLIGDGPMIANHAYGPPHDNYTGVNSAQIESCVPAESTLTILATCQANQRLCQCHVERGSVNDTLAVFLIGAYAGMTKSGSVYGSYFGYGPWDSDNAYSEEWAASYWPAFFDLPLGSPFGPAVKTGTVWHRDFTGDGRRNTSVSFDASTNRGCIRWAGAPCPAPPPPPPPPPPPAPAPGYCGRPLYNTGVASHGDMGSHVLTSWPLCCERCHGTEGCVAWAFHAEQSNHCHLHGPGFHTVAHTGCTSGYINASSGPLLPALRAVRPAPTTVAPVAPL